MKKRYAAGLALALVGILSGCGQANKTISITPEEQASDTQQASAAVEYEFSGNHADVNEMDFQRYIWNGSAWEKDENGFCTIGSGEIGKGEGTIQFKPESDALNAEYIINVDGESSDFGGSTQCAESGKLSGLPTEQLTAAVAMQEEKIDDLAVDTEIPLLVRTFRTDGTQGSTAIDAFSDPDNSEELKDSSYAEAYTVKFVKNDNL